jgi:hypothetical protein
MAMSVSRMKNFNLKDILDGANEHYPDGYLSNYFEKKTGEPEMGAGDSLADFIVRELRENFDAAFSGELQVAQAVQALERAKEDIQTAINGLLELRRVP